MRDLHCTLSLTVFSFLKLFQLYFKQFKTIIANIAYLKCLSWAINIAQAII